MRKHFLIYLMNDWGYEKTPATVAKCVKKAAIENNIMELFTSKRETFDPTIPFYGDLKNATFMYLLFNFP